ncbi:NAD(P)/FAD-dependent oxidoreductase [Conexibacter sp. DBS9H8]|uniref:flavin-containing monooxygenase n=1 Tax=Conexibacter sp. DBS9H8 TaxID=2937801 RepID=UPI00200DED70|nr:NAD(P)/FAD-dependent oxidoreductase [Conexibacter sp. DBS9H8]
MSVETEPAEVPYVDVVVVGAGFAGLRALYTLRECGFTVAVLDESDDIGGVWYWNRYPGARCDVESFDYSYAFSEELEQEWRWSERYATQPEILRYINHVADRFGLRSDIHCSQQVRRAAYDDEAHLWTVQTDTGGHWISRFLILAVGQLSTTKAPDLPGTDDFTGAIYHSARWPQEGVEFAGKRVGVVGTGSSGTQMIPIVAQQAEHLTVFQRTPNYSIPANNAPITDERDEQVKAGYRERRRKALDTPSGLGFTPNKTSALEATPEEREQTFEQAWPTAGFGFVLAFPDLLISQEANDHVSEFVRKKIAEKVRDPVVREKLMPRDHPFGTKRPPVDSGYFETFNRDNVELVDIRKDPIDAITATGILTAGGHHDLDIIVFATGFDAMTGSLLRPEIIGSGERTLVEKWADGPQTYLGLGVHGFPNMFIIAGPQSPSLLSNVLLSIEQHVDWLAALLVHARDHGIEEIEAEAEAERRWVEHVRERAEQTLYPKARSYYMGDDVASKPRVFTPYVGGVRGYRRTLERVVADGYDGFALKERTSGSETSSADAAALAAQGLQTR